MLDFLKIKKILRQLLKIEAIKTTLKIETIIVCKVVKN